MKDKKTWMRYGAIMWLILAMSAALFVRPAHATQVHGDPEGLYAHQIGHVFFIFSMAILIYWLRDRQLVKMKGWQFVQYSSFFFILWNAVAFLTHYFEEHAGFFTVKRAGLAASTISFSENDILLGMLLYFIKMDHLVLLPAIVYLYAGLRHLVGDAEGSGSGSASQEKTP